MSDFNKYLPAEARYRVRFPGSEHPGDELGSVPAYGPRHAAEVYVGEFMPESTDAVTLQVLTPLPGGGEAWLTYRVEPVPSVEWTAVLVEPEPPKGRAS